MDIYWLEQSEADLPQGEDWLSPMEIATLRALRFPKRRAEWSLGRWTAKNAFAIYFGCSVGLPALRDIEIHTAHSGAPEIYYQRVPSARAISISHRAGVAACALGPSQILLGCDIEIIEPHSDAFAADYFTVEEQELFAKAATADRSQLVTLFWSSKESALKALSDGLRLDTRSLTVRIPPPEENLPEGGDRASRFLSPGRYDNWNPLEVRHGKGQVFHGWWSQSGSLLRTVLASPPPGAPILLAQRRGDPAAKERYQEGMQARLSCSMLQR